MAQAVIGQIGGRSIELSHRGCISPSTQRHTQAALDSAVSSSAKTAVNNRRTARSLHPPFAILMLDRDRSARRAPLPSLTILNLWDQKCAGSNNPGASGKTASFSRKHEPWHIHTCHLPAAVSTVTRHGSAPVFSMSRPQKQHGPSSTVRAIFLSLSAAFLTSAHIATTILRWHLTMNLSGLAVVGSHQITPPITAYSRQNRPGTCIKTMHALHNRDPRAGFDPGAGRV